MAKQADYPAQNRKENKKVQFIVSREFAGSQTMREAFEQLIERQTCERFEESRILENVTMNFRHT